MIKKYNIIKSQTGEKKKLYFSLIIEDHLALGYWLQKKSYKPVSNWLQQNHLGVSKVMNFWEFPGG